MPIVFVIPGALRPHAGHRAEIRAPFDGGSLEQALHVLWSEAPALHDRVLTELDEVRPHINVFVDGVNVRDAGGMDARVGADAEVVLLPAVSGGSCPANQARQRRANVARPRLPR